MANLEGLSKLLNVAPATISRVLNNRPYQRVTEAKRQYIIEGAQKYGYVPNHAARSLTMQKTLNVGIIQHADLSAGLLANPNTFMPSVLMKMEGRLREDHYGLNMVFVSRDKPELSFSSLLRNRPSFDAFVFPTGVATKGIIDFAQESKLPYAIISDVAALGWAGNHFGVDEYADAEYAVKYLFEKGYSQIGVIGWDAIGRLQEGTFSRMAVNILSQYGLQVVDDWIITVDLTKDAFFSGRDHGREAMNRILSMDNKPQAIIASTDLIAFGLIDVMEAHGLIAGKDIAIVGAGNFEGSSFYSKHLPILTSFDPPVSEIGIAVAEKLLLQIKNNDVPSECKFFKSKLLVRKTA